MMLILVLRWAAFGWMAFIAAFGGQIVRTSPGAAMLAVIFLWTLAITLTPQRRGTVRDNGIGFEFDEVALGESGRLGLSLSVKARVALVGGTVNVRSRKGRGTEVEMWLPRMD